MHLDQFSDASPGRLVRIVGTDSLYGAWEHRAFVPDPLPREPLELRPRTYLAVADARAALATLTSVAGHLPNPQILRQGSLRTEAQSTSALEGIYAPLSQVVRGAQSDPLNPELREIFNYVEMANLGFQMAAEGRALTLSRLEDLQRMLMRGTRLEQESGRLRRSQVVIGRRADAQDCAPVIAARFVPAPPGDQLRAGVEELLLWRAGAHQERFDPVVSAALAHYQFETLHPFHDGNGRLGRYLIVLDLLRTGVLDEPTLTVSPWFEARRRDYYDALLGVSVHGDWDAFVEFFARGLKEAAALTLEQMGRVRDAQEALSEQIRAAGLRAEHPHTVVEIAAGRLTFTVREVAEQLGVSSTRARTLVNDLVRIGVLARVNSEQRKTAVYGAPRILGAMQGA